MAQLIIQDWSAGLNTLFDERKLAPFEVDGFATTAAESPYMENVEIVNKSIITSPGFSLVSSGGTGGTGTLNVMTYEKDATTRYLIIAQADHYYYITPSSTVWTDIGDYGTTATYVGGTVYKGTGGVRRAILGNDLSGNNTKLWDGTTFADLGGSPPDGWIMGDFMGRLFIVSTGSATLYYTNVDDETAWSGGGSIGFPDIITGFKPQIESAFTFTKRNGYVTQMYYNDSFSLSTPLKKPFLNSSGILAHKTLVPVYNDIYGLTLDGVQRTGADAQFIGQNLRVNSLSWKINPSLTKGALNWSLVQNACATFFEKKYYLGVPYFGATTNNKVFVYNWDYDSWTMRSGIYPSNFAIMANSNGQDELYFGSALGPDLFKFDNSYGYDGAGYNRIYVTKRFNFGSSVRQKNFKWIDIDGEIYTNTVMYVDVEVDGQTTTYQIDSGNIVSSSALGYYGDEYFGELYYGGQTSSSFKKFSARLPIPYSMAQGREMQITFRNNAVGEPWKIDTCAIRYDYLAESNVPSIAQAVSQV